MSQYNLISQAERLWLSLCREAARAEADGALNYRLRVENIREQAWWRLLRRLQLASKAARLGIKNAPAAWAELERRR